MGGGNPNPRTDHLKAWQYKKGQPSKGGRPPGTKNISTILTELLQVKIPGIKIPDIRTEDGKKKAFTGGELLAFRLFNRGVIKGDMSAMREIIDRVEGRPLQKQEVTGKNGEPLRDNTISVEFIKDKQDIADEDPNP
jgi:hypothetical protein